MIIIIIEKIGIEVRFADPLDPSNFEKLIDEKFEDFKDIYETETNDCNKTLTVFELYVTLNQNLVTFVVIKSVHDFTT